MIQFNRRNSNYFDENFIIYSNDMNLALYFFTNDTMTTYNSDIENRLWDAAEEPWANSKLKAREFALPEQDPLFLLLKLIPGRINMSEFYIDIGERC